MAAVQLRDRAPPGVCVKTEMECAFRIVKECQLEEDKLDEILNDAQAVGKILSDARLFYFLNRRETLCLTYAKKLLNDADFVDIVRAAYASQIGGADAWLVRVQIRNEIAGALKNEKKKPVGAGLIDQFETEFLEPRNWIRPEKRDPAPLTDQQGRPIKKFPNALTQGRGFASLSRVVYINGNCAFDAVATALQILAREAREFFNEIVSNIRLDEEYVDIKELVECLGSNPKYISRAAEVARVKSILKLRFMVERLANQTNRANVFVWLERVFQLQTLHSMVTTCLKCGHKQNRQRMPNIRFQDLIALAGIEDEWGLRGFEYFCHGNCKSIQKHRINYTLSEAGLIVDMKDVPHNSKSYSIDFLMTKKYKIQSVYNLQGTEYEPACFGVTEYNRKRNAPTHVFVMTMKEVPIDFLANKNESDVEVEEEEEEKKMENWDTNADLTASQIKVFVDPTIREAPARTDKEPNDDEEEEDEDDDDEEEQYRMEVAGKVEQVKRIYYRYCDSEPTKGGVLHDALSRETPYQLTHLYLKKKEP